MGMDVLRLTGSSIFSTIDHVTIPRCVLVWPREVEPWFHSWYRGRVETLDANI